MQLLYPECKLGSLVGRHHATAVQSARSGPPIRNYERSPRRKRGPPQRAFYTILDPTTVTSRLDLKFNGIFISEMETRVLGLSWNESNTPSSVDDLLPAQVSLPGGLREVIDPADDQTITPVESLSLKN